MAVMAADTAFTRADLDALPEDGRRHTDRSTSAPSSCARHAPA